MNPFEDIHEENWDKNSVSETYTKCSLSNKFKCVDIHNPYQKIEFSQRKSAPWSLIVQLTHKEHLHNATLGRNPMFNSDIHELLQTVVFVHDSDSEKTAIQWSILSSYIIDESILDFPLSKSYDLQHKDVAKFLYDFDRVSYNVLMFVRAIKEIYHKPSFAVINQ